MNYLDVNYDNELIAKINFDNQKINIFYIGKVVTTASVDKVFKEIKSNINKEDFIINSVCFCENVVEISPRSFNGKQIERVLIRSSNLKIIGSFAFANCGISILELDWKKRPHESALSFLDSNKGLAIINEGAFISNKIKELDLPSTILKVAPKAFAYNDLNKTFIPPQIINNISGNTFLGNSENKLFSKSAERKSEIR